MAGAEGTAKCYHAVRADTAGKRRKIRPEPPYAFVSVFRGSLDMSTLKGAMLVVAIIGCAVAARADRAAGDACAGQLTTPDAKTIYADSMAAGPTKETLVSTVERVTRELVDSKKIAWDVARDNGVAAAICMRQALE